MRYGVYLFFAGCVIVMTLWVAVWLPETRGVPVEHVMAAWGTCAPPCLPLPPAGSPWSKCMLRRIGACRGCAVTLSAPAMLPRRVPAWPWRQKAWNASGAAQQPAAHDSPKGADAA